MHVFAVLDLKGGQVVQAVAGRRDSYGPVQSVLTDSAAPSDVARALVRQLGLRTAYVADLDAIEGEPANLQALDAIASAGMRVIVDAGVGIASQAETLAAMRAGGERLNGVVVGLESLTDLLSLPAIFRALRTERAVFSLDLKAGRPLTYWEAIRKRTPEAIADVAWDAGFRRLIVLDLVAVGTGRGPATPALCRTLNRMHAWDQLISGGGVRDVDDLYVLERTGCDAAMVASALHRGAIGREQLARFSR